MPRPSRYRRRGRLRFRHVNWVPQFDTLVRHARRAFAQSTASLQLKPQYLKVLPPESHRKHQQHEAAQVGIENVAEPLRGDWLPLFRGSAPYVAMFRKSVMVMHIPGRLLDPGNRQELEGLLGDIALCALLGVRPVLVVSLEQRMVHCLRKTGFKNGDAATSAVPSSVGAARLEHLLKQEAGCACEEIEQAFGSLGRECLRHLPSATLMSSFSVFASSQLVTAVPASQREADGRSRSIVTDVVSTAGLLGKAHSVDVAQIQRRLESGDIVCITSMATGSVGGQVFYVPSEELAAEVSKALESTKLIFFTQGQRIVDVRRNRAVPTLQVKDATAFVDYAREHTAHLDDESRHVTEMLRYLQLLVDALAAGARRGHLIEPTRGALLQELYTTDGSGTLVSQDLYDGIRLANPSDVPQILQLIEPLIQKGLLRRRSPYEVEHACETKELYVWSRDGQTLGCAELHRFGDEAPDTAELGCFVVSPQCRGKGHGAVLLSYVERSALSMGVRRLFLLTTQTMQWFEEHGFAEAPLSELPASKRAAYDVSRSSKTYLKRLDALPSELQERFTFVEVDHL